MKSPRAAVRQQKVQPLLQETVRIPNASTASGIGLKSATPLVCAILLSRVLPSRTEVKSSLVTEIEAVSTFPLVSSALRDDPRNDLVSTLSRKKQ